MPDIRIIPNPYGSSSRARIRTIADALNRLMSEGQLSVGTDLLLVTIPYPGQRTVFPALRFRSLKGDEAIFSLPFSRACWAAGTLGERFRLPIEALDNAKVDCDGNVTLRDGRHFHAMEFDVVPLHHKLSELEETIVFFTIRYCKASKQCLRDDFGFIGIDYATLPQLRVRNVEALTNYINARLNKMPRKSGASPFKKVSVTAIKRVLSLTGIQQGERTQRKQTMRRATASP
jgi:hypothetical protein